MRAIDSQVSGTQISQICRNHRQRGHDRATAQNGGSARVCQEQDDAFAGSAGSALIVRAASE